MLLDSAVADLIGINVSDMHALHVTTELGGCSIGTIGDRLRLTSGAVTKMVDRLEIAGYVYRASDPDDRRRSIVHPVLARVEEIGQLYDAFADRLMTFIDALSAEHIQLVRDWTNYSRQAALEEAERIRNLSRSSKR